MTWGRMDRRSFVRRASGGAAGVALSGTIAPEAIRSCASDEQSAAEQATTAPGSSRTWLGASYWANRLQDWRRNGPRIECLQGGAPDTGRTVAVLTREIVSGATSATLSMHSGTLAAGAGFSGFLIGAGGGKLDYRATALLMRAGGTGGGLLCTYESDGHVRFRDHGDESNQFSWPIIPPSSTSGSSPPRSLSEDVVLTLSITPHGTGKFSLTFTAADAATKTLLSRATLSRVSESRILGGISLVSSPAPGASGARFWFSGFGAGGSKIALRPDRALGPIVGTLYSLSGTALKLTAQLMPIGSADPQTAQFQYRRTGTTTWIGGPTATVGAGFSLLFRVDDWDPTKAHDFRIVYGAGTMHQATFSGTVTPDPASAKEIVVAIVNCTIHSFRPLDRPSSGQPRIPGEAFLGLYTTKSLYFPYKELVRNVTKQRPHLLVSVGDQLYENRPTAKDPSAAPTLDYLYRYYLWLWTFRSLTRRIPTIVMVDDHDVIQGNLWGHDGAAAPGGDERQGGYVKAPSFINTLQRVQTAHNPDAFDPTPVQQGISVYYASFRYGGVSFAILEDHKFKGGDADGLQADGTPYPANTSLLGPRQEQFLRTWATQDASLPKLALTQTLWACLQTDEQGAPRVDHDSNGYPPAGRTDAVSLVKVAGALLVSGDQHLGSLVRHGITSYGDGPVQFTVPAAGTAYQRWFQPAAPLPNPESTPYTGDYTDSFGNKIHVLAVANPRVTFATYRQHYAGKRQDLGDQGIKREGYGIVRIDKTRARFVLECWPRNVDPTAAGAAQYPGWPYSLAFSAA